MLSPRPYVAAAAASVLVALYFVPSASASADPGDTPARTVDQVQTVDQATATNSSGSQVSAADTLTTDTGSGGLADTGAMNTKPYLLGGTVFLLAGAGLVINAGRRSRRELAEEEGEGEDA